MNCDLNSQFLQVVCDHRSQTSYRNEQLHLANAAKSTCTMQSVFIGGRWFIIVMF